MQIGRVIDTNSRAARLFGQLILLAACAVYSWYLYAVHVRPNQIIRDTFYETSCLVKGKRLSTKHHFFRGYRADFLVNYRTNQAQNTSWASGNGIDRSFHRHSNAEKEALSNFEIGETYLCWYDPANPMVVALVLRDYPLYPFLIPAIIVLYILYSLVLKQLLQWRRIAIEVRMRAAASIKKRKRKKRRRNKHHEN